ncbi:MAG: S1 RNA-binding domain-containing protein [Bacilli bacterium]|nr:S1 RNA-binding domain-containing protein [Bacilli bacterium]
MAKYEVGEIVQGCVTGIEKYGVFVNLDEYYTGLIHISEVSDLFVRNISDYVEVGQLIKCKIIDKNEEEKHLKLSIKDIDYQIGKKRLKKIVETKNGFNTLKKELNSWTEEKLQEISKKA